MTQEKAKIYNLLGFAQKAGKLVSGTNSVETLIGRPEAKLTLIAEDSSSSLLKQITSKCQSGNQRYLIIGTKDEFGNAIGKSQRTVIVIKDENIARAILDIVKKTEVL